MSKQPTTSSLSPGREQSSPFVLKTNEVAVTNHMDQEHSNFHLIVGEETIQRHLDKLNPLANPESLDTGECVFPQGRDFGPGAYLSAVLGISTRPNITPVWSNVRARKPKCAFPGKSLRSYELRLVILSAGPRRICCSSLLTMARIKRAV